MSPMRTLEPPNRLRIGLMSIIVLVLVTTVGQTFSSAPMLFAQPSYYGQLTDSAGVSKGDKVRIAGVDVGSVQAVDIEGDHILMKFSIGGGTIGTDSHLAVRTDTVLGRKVIELDPRGSRRLRPGQTLPLGQSTTPYQIYDAFFDVTRAASGWNIDTVKQSLNVLSETVQQTAPHLSAALDGVARFADTVGKRDEQITHLLAQANQVAGVLGNRSEQVNGLLVNTGSLLAAFNQRIGAIDALLRNVAAFGDQVRGLVDDNSQSPNLNHVLQQLDVVSDELVKRKTELAQTVAIQHRYVPIVNDAIGSGPYFKVTTANLAPFWILQPFVDAAFKNRGIEPEEFWRNAGMPEFRYPDPNGVRLPNGAPPPAPRLLEGTPEHPGPAVPPGGPCSYAPAAGSFPTPPNPLPCLGGTRAPWGGNYPMPVDVLTSPPNPDGLPATPGIAFAGQPGPPGQAPPNVPGTPVPVPSEAADGGRREPIGPGNPGAAPPPPPAAPYAPAVPAVPGPGNWLPAPFIPPGQGGNSQPGGGGGSLLGK